MEDELIVDRRRPRPDRLENVGSVPGAAWAVTAEVDVFVDPQTFEQERRLADRPKQDHQITIEQKAETLRAGIEPVDDLNRARLIRVFTGLIVLFLVSGMIWFVATRSGNGNFDSVPAGDNTPPQTERTESSEPTNSQASEGDNGSEIGQFTSDDPPEDQNSQVREDDRSAPESDEAQVDIDDSPGNGDAPEKNTSTGNEGLQEGTADQESTDSQDPTSPVNGSTDPAKSDDNSPAEPAPTTVTTALPVRSETQTVSIVRVQTQSRLDGGTLAGVSVTLVAEPAGQISSATSGSSGFAFVSMPSGCGTLTYRPPAGYEVVSPAGGSIRVCSEDSNAIQFASFRSAENATSEAAATTVSWDTSPGPCDVNDKRSFGADVTHTGPAVIRVRMAVLDSFSNVVHQSHVITTNPSTQTSVELEGIPTGRLTVRIINASNNETIKETSQYFSPCRTGELAEE